MSHPFAPADAAEATITVSSSSQRVKIKEGTAGALVDVRITNLGTAPVWIRAGDVTVTATNARTPVPAGPFVEVLQFAVPATGALYIAAIAAGSTGNITFTPGDGL